MKGIIKNIKQINFGLMSPDDIRKMATVEVVAPDTYDGDGYPIENGLMDPRLGVIDPSLNCKTCGFRGGECQGHFGMINLARPVIHVGFGDTIHKILRSVCNDCSRILLNDMDLEYFTEKMNESYQKGENLADLIKQVQEATKKVKYCPHCLKEVVEKFINEGTDYTDYDTEQLVKEICKSEEVQAAIGAIENFDAKEILDEEGKDLTDVAKAVYALDDNFVASVRKAITTILLKEDENLYKRFDTVRVEDMSYFGIKNLQGLNYKELNKIGINKFRDLLPIVLEDLGEERLNELLEKDSEDGILESDVEKLSQKLYKSIINELNILADKDANKNVFEELVTFMLESVDIKEQESITITKPTSIIQNDYTLTASEVRERLESITDEDAFVLGVNPEVARPEWMVLTVLPVPPVTVRPSITLDTGERSEDDLTHKLVDILRINQRLTENMEAGAPQLIVEDLWELLQYHVTTYFDNEASSVPPARHRSGRPLKTLAQRLKGKEGRFRSNLSGKRVNFSARTVISPDPNISINEVGVPEMIAKEVTVPTYVNEWNIDDLRERILKGPNVHPGANYVKKDRGGRYNKVRVLDSNKEVVAENLKYGDIVLRHLKDGDVVLFNRQPSLHRMSMMAHEVRVLPYKTFRLNLCVCPPYNADFDGDEMNMHVFQTDESRAEAKSLMRVQEHILSPRFGGPIIGAIHDHISGAYLLTRTGSEFSEADAFQVIRKSHLLDLPWKKNDEGKYVKIVNNEEVKHNYFARKNENWTGKELFSLLLPYDFNLNYRAEICYKCEECQEEECPYDGYVVIKNGELIHGSIDEKAYGSFSGKILDKIVKEYGPTAAKNFLDRSTDLAICGIMKTGITTSTNDEEIPEEATERIEEHLDKAEDKVEQLIEAYEEGYLEALPGRGLEETLEMKIMQVLGEVRDSSGKIAETYFTMQNNHSVVMARTGARASMLNLAQITACVGQQAVRGGRIERGYLNRPLPHFKKGDLGAKAKGFVRSSYKEGLDPVEFFFHAMGGREGLVDTAIRTAQSGYMQRRLVNALEDLQVRDSGLVLNNNGQVIQRLFGEDGIDPAKSDFGKVADYDKLIDEIRMESK